MTEASLLSQHVPSIGITAFFLLLLIITVIMIEPRSLSTRMCLGGKRLNICVLVPVTARLHESDALGYKFVNVDSG